MFGLLHGAYLTTNHAWRVFRPSKDRVTPGRWTHARSVGVTYLAVLVAAVFFRAGSCGDALSLLGGMLGLQGLGPGMALSLPAPAGPVLEAIGLIAGSEASSVPVGDTLRRMLGLSVLYGIVWFAPNTQQIFRLHNPALERVTPWRVGGPAWQPSPGWAVAIGVSLALGILATSGTAEFLYFQF